MYAYGIFMTVVAVSSMLLVYVMIAAMHQQKGKVIYDSELQAGEYAVVAKSPDGHYAIVKNDKFAYGVKYGDFPEPGRKFKWEVKKIKGTKRKAVPL